MTNPTNANPALGSVLPGYDPTGHQTGIAMQVGTPVQDATTGVWYAPLLSTVGNANANGQATMANSSPVVLASDELVPIGLNAGPPFQQWNAVDFVGDNSHLGIGAVAQSAFNGSPTYTYDRRRIANVFKTATATASGDTALWTPTSGTKFRIMRYRVEVTANAAAASGAVLAIVLRDATTALALAHSVFIPATAGTIMGQGYVSPWIDLSNGPQSALANNVLNVNLSFALTAGNVRVVVAGNEE